MRGVWFGLATCLVLSTSLSIAADRETAFEKLSRAFESSTLPESTDLQGYWSGRCISSAEPSTLRAAIFVLKTVKNEEEFPPNRLSLTYYWTDTVKPETYDTWTPAKVEADPDLKAWFKREQWNRLTTDGKSVINTWESSPSVRYRREVRLFDDEFNRVILLRATRVAAQTSDVSAICHFSTKLGTGGTGGEEEAVDIRFQNNTNLNINYAFRYNEDFEWSQKTLPFATVHVWQRDVKGAEPTIRFDSSLAIGIQERVYRLKARQHYYFLRTTIGVDLYETIGGGPIPLWQGAVGWITGRMWE